MHRLAGYLIAVSILFGSSYSPASAQDKSLTVFAAASMKNALDDIAAAYAARTGVRIVASYAASSALAKQIEQGAPADIFASADTDWMDYAIGKKTIDEPTRVNILAAMQAVRRTRAVTSALPRLRRARCRCRFAPLATAP